VCVTLLCCVVFTVGIVQFSKSSHGRSVTDMHLCLLAIFSAELDRQEQRGVCVQLLLTVKQ